MGYTGTLVTESSDNVSSISHIKLPQIPSKTMENFDKYDGPNNESQVLLTQSSMGLMRKKRVELNDYKPLEPAKQIHKKYTD